MKYLSFSETVIGKSSFAATLSGFFTFAGLFFRASWQAGRVLLQRHLDIVLCALPATALDPPGRRRAFYSLCIETAENHE